MTYSQAELREEVGQGAAGLDRNRMGHPSAVQMEQSKVRASLTQSQGVFSTDNK